VNTEQLKKNVGRLLRIRPEPKFRWMSDLEADYRWRLDEVTKEGVTLVCQNPAGHKVQLSNDNVREYRQPDVLMLKCHLFIEGAEVRVEPF
jgi:hypothetical protein